MAKSARARDEIVADIVAVLTTGIHYDNDDEKIGSHVYVQSALTYLSTLYPSPDSIPLWGWSSENLKQVKKLRLQIQKLQSALNAMPDRALPLLFAPDVDGTGKCLPSVSSQEKMTERARATGALLAYLRSRCDQMIAAPPGLQKSALALQHECVAQADDLLVRHNLPVTNSSSETSPLRRIASLLYEGVTGQYGKDLESSCRKFFKE